MLNWIKLSKVISNEHVVCYLLLGNILLNIVLNKSIPVSRQGTNNVSLICVPNPPIEKTKDDKAPVCLLIRVKTSETADELLSQMNSCKNWNIM